MTITDQLLLMFSALGAINAWLLAAYFFWRRPAQLSDRLLALLLLMLSIRVLKSVLFYFNPGIIKLILQLGLSACWLIGPLLYAYCHKICWPEHKSSSFLWPLPVALLLMIVVGLGWPYQHNAQLWQTSLYQVINYSWLGWILLSALLLWQSKAKLMVRQHDTATQLPMILSVFTGNLLIWAAYYFASYTSYISGALTFSFLLYVAALTIYLKRHTDNKTAPEPYANKKLPAEQVIVLQQQLEQLMQTQQVFLDANLRLTKLSKQLGWSVAKLSQLLNDNLQTSFNDYINAYRIQYARQLIEQQKPLKMADMAEQCGFNSLSTFYAAFKKVTKLTPARYKQQLQQSSGIINPVSGIIS